MLRSVLVGIDGSAYSAAALEQHALGATLGCCARWAGGCRCRHDLPGTACAARGRRLQVQRDETLLAEAHHKVAQFLEHCTQQCAKAG